MLMRNPKEFERVAQEWAVKYAGAPKRERGEGSGGSATETLKQRQQKSKAEEEAERIARYTRIRSMLFLSANRSDLVTGVTTKQ